MLSGFFFASADQISFAVTSQIAAVTAIAAVAVVIAVFAVAAVAATADYCCWLCCWLLLLAAAIDCDCCC